ncbi:MAG: ComF family protein [Alphaproteobacteria bacterium]|nr:ComF family protein [Alphaproteobacteria bacterium]
MGRVLDVLFPPRCLKCGLSVDRAGALCAGCWSEIRFIAPPLCAACGLPFDHDPGPDALCGVCSATVPPFDRARAVFIYGEESRDIILGFKHADRTQAAPAFAEWMARSGAALIADADIIAPVPLHRRRLFSRRFNQAALLARYLAPRAPGLVVPDLLIRHRATPSQVRMNASARRRNVKGAFAMRPGNQIDGKRVLLVDDVYTTGATVAECARVLVRAAAKAVDVLTLARVVRAGEPF